MMLAEATGVAAEAAGTEAKLIAQRVAAEIRAWRMEAMRCIGYTFCRRV